MAVPTLRGAPTYGAGSVAKPTGTASGDRVLIYAWRFNGTLATPSGFTVAASFDNGVYFAYVFEKVAGGSEPSSYSVPNGNLNAVSVIGSSPVGTTGSDITASAATQTVPAATAAADDTLLLGFFTNSSGTSVSSAPAGMTLQGSGSPAGTTWRTYSQTVAAGSTGTRGITWFAAGHLISALVPLAPANTAPTAPTLTAPTDGSTADLAGTPTFKAIYNDPDVGDSISAFYLRRKISGAGSYEYWNVSTGSWQATEVKNADSGVAQGEEWTYTFPLSSWVNGNVYNWSVAFEDSQGVKGPYATDFTVTGEAPATYTVTAPSGTVTTTSRPTTTFSRSHPTGVKQARFRVRIFTQAVYEAGGFDPATSTAADESGWVVSETLRQWTGTGDLTNGGTYRTYVQGESVNAVLSAWAFSTFTLSLTPPAAPTVAVIADPGQARVTVTITGQHDDQEFPDVTYLLQRSDDAGVIWATVRHAAALVPDGMLVATVDDREPPPGVEVRYRAFTIADFGAFISSDPSTVQTATLHLTGDWLTPILNPAAAEPIRVRDWGEDTQPAEQGVFYPLGSATAVVIDGVRQATGGELVIHLPDRTVRDQVAALLDPPQTLLLQIAADTTDGEGEQRYIRPVYPTGLVRAPGTTRTPRRWLRVGWVTVAPPPVTS